LIRDSNVIGDKVQVFNLLTEDAIQRMSQEVQVYSACYENLEMAVEN
jgi:hypothetical protein